MREKRSSHLSDDYIDRKEKEDHSLIAMDFFGLLCPSKIV